MRRHYRPGQIALLSILIGSGAVSTSFTFRGSVTGTNDEGLQRTISLTGAGIATGDYEPYGAVGVGYDFESAAATPEPASLALLGSGLLGLIQLAIRRRQCE